MLKFFHQSQNLEQTKNKETTQNEESVKQKQRSNEENRGEDFLSIFEIFLRILGMRVFNAKYLLIVESLGHFTRRD